MEEFAESMRGQIRNAYEPGTQQARPRRHGTDEVVVAQSEV